MNSTTNLDFSLLNVNGTKNSSTTVLNMSSTPNHCTVWGEPLTMFLLGGVGVTLFSVIGIIGNILSIVVLTRPTMRSSTNIILLGLSVCDLVFVIIALIFYGLPGLLEYFCVWMGFTNVVFPLILPPLFPIISIAQLGSVYFTVSVTVERFIVVYRPLKARSYCTMKNAVYLSISILLFAILFTMPTWWELSYENKYDANYNWTGYRTTVTALRKNKDYVLYYINWSCLLVYRLIPFVLLVVLNVTIYKKIHEANKTRRTMTQSESNEISIAKMLVFLVTIFLLCNLLRVYLSMKEAFTRKRNSSELIALSGLFLTINSAVNFIIYCLMGKKFRRTCAQLFCGRAEKVNNTSSGTGNTTQGTSTAMSSLKKIQL